MNHSQNEPRPQPSSFTRNLKLSRDQRDAGFNEAVLNNYFHQLVGLANARLKNIRTLKDGEDVALSALRSFFEMSTSRLQQVADRSELWRLLAAMTLRKVIDEVRHARTQRQGAGRVMAASADDLDRQMHTAAPTPEDAALFMEESNKFLDRLPDKLRSCAKLKLEGHSNAESAQMLGVSERTIELWNRRIRDEWIVNVADAYESDCQTDDQMPIESYVNVCPRSDLRQKLLSQLIGIEMTHVWQRCASDKGRRRIDTVEDYIKRFPSLSNQAVVELCEQEFRNRHMHSAKDDQHVWLDYLDRIPALHGQLCKALRTAAFDLSPVELQVYGEKGKIGSFRVDEKLELGRTSSADEGLMCRYPIRELDRIVIADAGNSRVSRRHLQIDLVGVCEFLVQNTSERSKLLVNEDIELLPSKQMHVGEGTTIVVGNVPVKLSKMTS